MTSSVELAVMESFQNFYHSIFKKKLKDDVKVFLQNSKGK